MNTNLILYHGSPQIIEKPEFGKGKTYNDYGLGFYCTESLGLAKEWACTWQTSGYANKYQLSTDDLKVFSLSLGDSHILNWLALLMKHRTFRLSSDLAIEAKEYLIQEFSPHIQCYDVICGYRADDSYFSFATAFLSGTLSLEQLGSAMTLGELGEQVVLKSKKAFEQIQFESFEQAEKSIYFPKREQRDTQARTALKTESKQSRASDGIYILDILREEWKNDDSRLRRNLSK